MAEHKLETRVYPADPEDPEIRRAVEIHHRRRPLEPGEVRENERTEWIELTYGIEDVDEVPLGLVTKRVPMISSRVRRRREGRPE
jgi:hypothetical protein